ncbi:MAG: GNAT family N-acetyltransferase [Actinomycetales bacterium]
MSDVIWTARLALVTLPRDLLDAATAGLPRDGVLQSIDGLLAAPAPERRPQLPSVPPVSDPCDVLGEAREVLLARAEQLDVDPDPAGLAPWLSRAVVWRQTGVLVGYANFHTRPDADGRVEIGYRVAPQWRGQGIATEVADGMWEWARQRGAQVFVASVRPDNEPSLRILRRAGFVQVGEQIDEADGLELVFERPAT